VVPPVLEFAKRTEEHVKACDTRQLFEEFGFNYIGHRRPRPGCADTTLGNIRNLEGPQFLHVVTQKARLRACGRGLRAVHGVGKFDPAHGVVAKETPNQATRRYSAHGCATWRNRMTAGRITPAMCEGSGMAEFAQKFPQRYFDVASPNSTR